jgi:YedE family putative selenium metabolism protein
MPIVMIAMLALLLVGPQFGRNADGDLVGPIFFSASGPGSQHAPIFIALGIGLLVGFLAQRSRFCTVGAIRDSIMLRDNYLLKGMIALIVAAVITNLVLGQFQPGFADQPVAHSNQLWNFGGMVLAGLAFSLAGGCPGRQLFLIGEGDGDAAVFVTGMLAGTALAHNFSMASSRSGPGLYGPAIVIIGIVVCVIIGLTMRERKVGGML